MTLSDPFSRSLGSAGSTILLAWKPVERAITRPMPPSRSMCSPHECSVLYESRPRMHGARRTTRDTSDRYIIALHRTGMGSGLGTGDGAGVGSGEGTGAGAGVGSGQGTGAGAGVGSGEGTDHETA